VDRELETNSRVRGHVDWRRRFDHMQQHTGSICCPRLSSARQAPDGQLPPRHVRCDDRSRQGTGRPIKSRGSKTPVNAVLWEDREVCVRFVTAAEAAKLPLRKGSHARRRAPHHRDTDYDLSACGGTHVKSTGAIGVIAISGVERFKGGLRVEFVCGARALKAYRGLKNAVSGSVRLLSVLPDELPSAD
jgi:alanyl-tRNA synthetase